MRLDNKGKVVPYLTKKDRINELETALSLVELSATLEDAVNIAIAFRRVDNRWQGDSPLAYDKLKAEEDKET